MGTNLPKPRIFWCADFFCITGFFFDKVIKSKDIDWGDFFVSRIRRVAPLYYLTSLLVFIIAASFSGFEFLNKESITTIAGLVTFNFIDNPMKIGGVSLVPLSSVTWTLVHEWRFYAVLPMVAIFTDLLSVRYHDGGHTDCCH